MLTRQQFVRAGAAALAGPLAACAPATGDDRYDAAVRATWRHGDGRSDDAAALQRELVRYATLAPSSHNTQCWKFRIEAQAITILPDLARRCPAVDPDDHHLFVSLGCAAENLVQAALAHGLHGEAGFDRAAGIRVALTPIRALATPLFQAITQRQCTRGEFDGRPLSNDELKQLEQAGSGAGVRLLLLSEKPALEQILAFVVAGNTAQMNDPAFMAELKTWIRFGRDEAVHRGDGLFSGSSGNPSLPRWLGSRLFDLAFTPKGENDKYARQLRSSAGVAVFVADADDPPHWIETGRCYERFALQAAALGIRNAFVNQPVEVPGLRSQLAAYLGVAPRRPDLVVRFGRGPRLPASLRRPVQAVLA